jgi:hypothetical protein
LAVIFISWFAWIFYLLLAPIKKKNWNLNNISQNEKNDLFHKYLVSRYTIICQIKLKAHDNEEHIFPQDENLRGGVHKGVVGINIVARYIHGPFFKNQLPN